MDALERLFGSAARAKLLKFFLMNPSLRVSAPEGGARIRLPIRLFLAEAKRLLKLGIIKTAVVRVEQADSRRRKRRRAPQRQLFFANQEFPLFPELRQLMLKSAPHAKGQLAAKIRRLGSIKLAILAGIFINQPNSRLDLFIVGDSLKRSRVKAFIQWLEAEVGKELTYAAMSSQEFRYRRDMYDRFVRDVLESPHEKVLNKLGV